MCKGCEDQVYPYRQVPLIKMQEKMSPSLSPHPMELCGKCQELGRPCWLLDVDEDDDD